MDRGEATRKDSCPFDILGGSPKWLDRGEELGQLGSLHNDHHGSGVGSWNKSRTAALVCTGRCVHKRHVPERFGWIVNGTFPASADLLEDVYETSRYYGHIIQYVNQIIK